MAGFEDLIRDTLAKQGEPTHANRARVYASARSALERMIAKSGDPDAAQTQREKLEEAIERIEDEHTARIGAATPQEPRPEEPLERGPEEEPTPAAVAPAPVVDTPIVAPEPMTAPMVSSAPPLTLGSAPLTQAAAPLPPEPVLATPASAPQKQSRRESRRAAKLLDDRRRGRPLVKLLLWLVILGGIAAAGWWVWNTAEGYVEGLAPAAPPPQREIARDGDDGWVSAFDAATDIEAVTTGEAVSSQLVRDGQRSWLRLASSADPDEGANGQIRVRVPPGIMRTLSGRRATFEATVRTAPGTQPHPFSVSCEFAAGRCNRNRFEAGLVEQPFLFSADMGSTEEAGTLVFDTDLDGLGRAIDLGAIRVAGE